LGVLVVDINGVAPDLVDEQGRGSLDGGSDPKPLDREGDET